MKITTETLKSQYGISLPPGKYEIRVRDGFYKVDLIKDNTDGCILVGLNKGEDLIYNCSATYDYIYGSIEEALRKKEKVKIWILNSPQ